MELMSLHMHRMRQKGDAGGAWPCALQNRRREGRRQHGTDCTTFPHGRPHNKGVR